VLGANIQPKSSIPIGAKVEISPKGFTLGVKADIERIPSNLGGQFATLGADLQPKNAQNWPQVFLALTPSVKRALLINFSILRKYC
jgi:hypothetical protein